ncbi:hypothetical protein Cri9333_1087 [Crinalium epipsammum PCC 9333]|uniref:Uncharacterized protein n=2 Tax=Crinalium TaxID=241421 RepID=K9VV62_9CYAN|nr:hypothetical protein Cri9333_1087 [Crinalium epipsammum PCC 9333]
MRREEQSLKSSLFKFGSVILASCILMQSHSVKAADDKNNPVNSEGGQTQNLPENSVTPENKVDQVGNSIAPTDVKIITPTSNTVLDIPATSVVLQFPAEAKVELRVNGVLVESSLIGRTETDPKTKLVTQTWYGVSFREGENILTAQATINGVASQIASVKVQVAGDAQRLTVETVEKQIPADNRSTATVQGQLLDKNGNRSNRDAIVTLTASGGEFVGVDADTDQPGFQVQARQGQFTASLRSSSEAKVTRIRAATGALEAFNQIEFQTSLRPSIATGVIDVRLGGRGTNYYENFREFLPPSKDNKTQLNISSAVFATGKVGDWLFTGAYNSDRALNEDCSGNTGLSRDVQACEAYSVYGDSSTKERTTRSQDSVFLRFERNKDYVMWGDYDTQEFARPSQEFTATSRQLHGFKTNYNIGNLQLTGLYANNVKGFQRDTIAPDGTSGYYFVSRRLLVTGSEEVFIELEELNRPGTVLSRKKLNRGSDYQIDYDRGTLLFNQPILRTDVSPEGLVLVRRIVTTYQFESKDPTANIFAGRAQYNFSQELNKESWLASSYFRENQGMRHFEIYGADALISLGSKSNLVAEYAHSKNDSELMGMVSGSAYRVEANAEITDKIQTRAYLRSADTGFANNATTSFVAGQTRYGFNVNAQVLNTTTFRAQYDHEDNRGIAPRPLNTFEDLFNPGLEAIPGSKVDNSLTTISAGIQQSIGNSKLDVDFIHRQREDRLQNSPLSANSNQLRSRLTVPVNNQITLRAQNEINLSSEKDIAYPDRTILGVDWAAYPGINISLNHQFFTGQTEGNNSITSLDMKGDYKLGTDTALTGRYSIIGGGGNSMTTQGAIGINQGVKITPGLRLNLAYEHVFGDILNRTGAGQQFLQPFAVGQSASAIGVQGGDSYSVGLDYTDSPDFKASARYEHRSSSDGNNNVISANVAGKVSPALTAIANYQQANFSNQTLKGLGDTANLRLGLAFRDPNNDSFNALLRYEYRKNPATIPDTLLLGSGTGSEDHTIALETIYAPSWQWEFYGKYALRDSTSYLAQDLIGNTTTSLAQVRATYRLGYSMDLVGEGRWINQTQTGYKETGLLIELGYYITPNLRLAAGYGFGKVDDRDFDGARSAGGFTFGLTVKLNELFSGFGLQKVAPPQQQESQVQPVSSNSSTSPAATTDTPATESATTAPPSVTTDTPATESTTTNPTVPAATTPAVTLPVQGATP